MLKTEITTSDSAFVIVKLRKLSATASRLWNQLSLLQLVSYDATKENANDLIWGVLTCFNNYEHSVLWRHQRDWESTATCDTAEAASVLDVRSCSFHLLIINADTESFIVR